MIGVDDAAEHLFDIGSDENLVKYEGKGVTTRAILRGLSRNENWLPRLIVNGSLDGRTGDFAKAKQLYNKGIAEIRALLVDKASQEILEFADLKQ